MKIQTLVFSILLLTVPVLSAEEDTLTPEQAAVALVDKGVQLIAEQGEAALETIGDPEGEFFDKETALYAFVYDEDVVIRAHPYKPTLVGRSYQGKPDVRGKKFRDEIVAKAISAGAGWTEYSYQKPGESGIHRKKVYGKRVEYDGRKYVVCAGVYID